MMGKGAEGGCARNGCSGSTNIGLLPFSKSLLQFNSANRMRGSVGPDQRGLDVFSQALKSLAIKPAFGESNVPALNSVPNSGDYRRKQRVKRQDGGGALLKDSSENGWQRDSNVGPFWLQMEDYFRETTSNDIQLLLPKTKLDKLTLCNSLDPLLQMPAGMVVHSGEHESLSDAIPFKQSSGGDLEDQTGDLGTHRHKSAMKRKSSTAVSTSKRRKLMLSSDFETITAVISPSENGAEEICHVCYVGDSDEHNQILFCDSCNVAVHQECYGVKVVPTDPWLCSLCSHRRSSKDGISSLEQRDCVFCPVRSGALKVVALSKENSSTLSPPKVIFGHLFCCQWIPETFIGDMDTMEPIMNIEGIRKERWKHLCSVCKEKYGACIQCSHGMCATAFHPLCARQARLRMEVSSKANTDELELRAFCSKHTQVGKQVYVQTQDESDHGIGGKDPDKLNTGISRGRDVINGGYGSTCAKDDKNGAAHGDLLDQGSIAGFVGYKGNHTSEHANTMHLNADKDQTSSGKEALENVQCPSFLLGLQEELLPPDGVSPTTFPSDDAWKDKSRLNGSCRTYRPKRRKLEQCTKETIPSANSHEREDMVALSQSQTMHVATHVLGNDSLEACAKADEERRQRGLRGEASTSTQGSPVIPKKDQAVDSKTVLEQELAATPKTNQTSVHPFLLKRLLEIQNDFAGRSCETGLGKIPDPSQLLDSLLAANASPNVEVQETRVTRTKRYQARGLVSKQNMMLKFGRNGLDESLEAQLKQLECAKKLGILDMTPKDELDGEILAAQMSLIAQAQGNQYRCEQLVLKIIPTLSTDLRASLRRSKDLALVDQYLSMLREAKKQGRKERRSKEAQAVLAAATAVVAGSSRLGSLRKDATVTHSIDGKLYSAKDTFCTPVRANSHFCGVSNMAARPSLPKSTGVGWISSVQTASFGRASLVELEKKVLDSRNFGSDLSSGESRQQFVLCDVCKDPTVVSPLAICKRCKVSVHEQCYCMDPIVTSDWHCEPCTEIAKQFLGSEATNRAMPGHGVTCSICLGRSGAFKRSADSKWVHAFCLQWIPETSCEKDEVGAPDSSKSTSMEKTLQECSICHTRLGSRLRCSFGHCHGSFHPLCARDWGLFMSVKRAPGNRVQHRAYCEKHSEQQRQKAASKKFGSADEFSVLLQMRADLERVRILCDRVCKRERLKRDRLACSLDLYTAHLSSLSSSAMASNDLSSTSNTLDSTVALPEYSPLHNHHLHDPVMVRPLHGLESESYSWNSVAGEGHKYQESLSGDSVYQTPMSCSEASRETPAKSQLSDGAAVHGQPTRFTVLAMDGVGKTYEPRRFGKHQKAETLHTEVVMTPTEASVQNQRLPKGYAYVPVGTLPKGKINLTGVSALKEL